MHRHKARPGQFERMNARRERGLTRLRCQMIDAAMAGGRSGFAVQMRMGRLDKAPESWTLEQVKDFQKYFGAGWQPKKEATVALREARPRER